MFTVEENNNTKLSSAKEKNADQIVNSKELTKRLNSIENSRKAIKHDDSIDQDEEFDFSDSELIESADEDNEMHSATSTTPSPAAVQSVNQEQNDSIIEAVNIEANHSSSTDNININTTNDSIIINQTSFSDSEHNNSNNNIVNNVIVNESTSSHSNGNCNINDDELLNDLTKDHNVNINSSVNVPNDLAPLNPSSSNVMDAFCPIPITPKKLVDCIDSDETEFFRKNNKKNSGKKQNDCTDNGNNVVKKIRNNADDNDDDDDDDVFYSEEEEDDEIIVQFLGHANQIAEARLAARRQARAEAREIRMRELERQQKELEQNADRVFDMQTAAGIDPLARSRLTITNSLSGSPSLHRGSSMSSRRSSEDSLEEEGRSLRDIRHELKDVEERFRKAMIANAQLDNERSSQSYQIQLLKDKMEEMEEQYSQLQREHKDKSRENNALKRNVDKLVEELRLVKGQLDERDYLISEQGLVIVLVENEDGTDAKRALVSVENAQLLGSVQGSLDVRLKKFTEEKQQLQKEVQTLQQQLEDIKSQGRGKGSMNGPLGIDDEYEAQREANKIISDYKYKLQKAEQELASLQASLARSETQVIRYKSTAEAAEKAEAELKIERRKLQRENREATERLEELETSNNHLLKRLDKLKTAKSTLLKEL